MNPLIAKQSAIRFWVSGVRAQQFVSAKQPKVAQLTDSGPFDQRDLVFTQRIIAEHKRLDLRRGEAGDLEVEVEIELRKS